MESHTERIEIIPPIFVVSFTLFSPLNINGHMLSGVMAQEVTTAYNTRVLTLFYCLQISSIVFSYTSILSRIPSLRLSPWFYPFSSLSSSVFSFIGVSLSFPSSFIIVFLSLIVTYTLLFPLSLLFDSLLRSRHHSSHPTSVPFDLFLFLRLLRFSLRALVHTSALYTS